MLTVEQVKEVIESIKFTGLPQLMKFKLWTKPLGDDGITVWLSVEDLPDARTSRPEESGRFSVNNNLNFYHLGRLDTNPKYTVESVKNAIYNQAERFLIHELREGMWIDGKLMQPAHGPRGEFYPKGKFLENPE